MSFSEKLLGRKKAFYKVAMESVVKDITDGIRAGMAVSGGNLPGLTDFTIELKRIKYGEEFASSPLIGAGLLSTPTTYQQLNQWRLDQGTIKIKPVRFDGDTPRDEAGYLLQMQGVGKRKKKFFFFGISKEAEKIIMDLWDATIIKALEDVELS